MADVLVYEIQVRDRLDEKWAAYFSPFSITYGSADQTILTGSVHDQAELFGVLLKIRDLGLTLISLAQVCDLGEASCASF